MSTIEKKETELLTGEELFTLKGRNVDFNVLDFWRFQFSNLSDLEGRVGEFLVAMALGKETSDNNNGWTLWDIDYKGYRIEVKTTAYYQPWRENKDYIEQRWGKDASFGDNNIDHNYSTKRTFGITKTRDPKDNEFKRMNDIYVFVLNKGKTKEEANPLKLENWEFYVIATKVINDKCGNNKTISLSKVKKLMMENYSLESGITFEELKTRVDQRIEELNNC